MMQMAHLPSCLVPVLGQQTAANADFTISLAKDVGLEPCGSPHQQVTILFADQRTEGGYVASVSHGIVRKVIRLRRAT